MTKTLHIGNFGSNSNMSIKTLFRKKAKTWQLIHLAEMDTEMGW